MMKLLAKVSVNSECICKRKATAMLVTERGELIQNGQALLTVTDERMHCWRFQIFGNAIFESGVFFIR